MREITAKRHVVAAVVADGMSAFEFAVPCEVFGIDRSDVVGKPWYRFMVCAAQARPIRATAGFDISAPYGLDALGQADTIVVPAIDRGQPPEELLDALQQAHSRGARLVSVCTGAFVLAAAGLLDGRRATTHWMHASELARRYPKVTVDPSVLYIDDGDILTSAGTAAGIDLCLHIVRSDYGAEIANTVARRMVVPPHRDGGQAQFIDLPLPAQLSGDLFAETLAWLAGHLGDPVSVEDLARRAAMSPRTFARHFRSTTGTTPHQWLLRQRILLARRLLETTDLSVDVVAAQCGLGTAANLRLHFHRLARTSPSAYRRTFRAG